MVQNHGGIQGGGRAERLTELEYWLANAAQQGVAEHEVERHLFREMLALGSVARGLSEVGGAKAMRERNRLGKWT